VVAINGALKEVRGVDASGMIVGSAVGSAIVQGSVVLGIAGLVGYLPAGPRMIRRYGTTLLLSVGLTAALFYDGVASRVDALVMLLVYGLNFAALFRLERTEEDVAERLGFFLTRRRGLQRRQAVVLIVIYLRRVVLRVAAG
jgi:Ca2+/Na+ antiporter